MRLMIDTDAGIDDAQAIMLALAHPGVDIEAITTVCGNVSLDKVIANVFTTLDVFERDIPVYAGAGAPMVAGWSPESLWHGEDGLGNFPNRPPTQRHIEAEHAALALVRLANAYPGELTLVALAPLTNIALAVQLDPSFPRKIRDFVFMGGTIAAHGNTDHITAEWNIFCDPEAAYITLKAFPHARMVSWETTLDHPMAWAKVEPLFGESYRAARFFKTMCDYFMTPQAERQAMPFFLLPDPLAMAVALEPDAILESMTRYVTVELHGTHTRGQTIIDHRGRLGQPPNVEIVTSIDMDRVYAQFERAVTAV